MQCDGETSGMSPQHSLLYTLKTESNSTPQPKFKDYMTQWLNAIKYGGKIQEKHSDLSFCKRSRLPRRSPLDAGRAAWRGTVLVVHPVGDRWGEGRHQDATTGVPQRRIEPNRLQARSRSRGSRRGRSSRDPPLQVPPEHPGQGQEQQDDDEAGQGPMNVLHRHRDQAR